MVMMMMPSNNVFAIAARTNVLQALETCIPTIVQFEIQVFFVLVILSFYMLKRLGWAIGTFRSVPTTHVFNGRGTRTFTN